MLVPQLRSDDELVVVDGGSSDDTADVVAACAGSDHRVRLLVERGTNIPEARNAAIRSARHGVIACTDAGCLPVAGWLEALRSHFTGPSRTDLVTGVYRVAASTPVEVALATACYPSVEEALSGDPITFVYGRLLGRSFDPTMPTGRSVAFTRAAWSSVGGFPEHLATAEDVSFGMAIAAAGLHCVLEPAAEVLWEQRPSLRDTALMYYRYGVGDGLSGDRRLIGRNVARGLAYLFGPLLWRYGGRSVRVLVAAGAAFYLSLPVRRVLPRADRDRVLPLLPLALALKDVTKAAGCAVGVSAQRRRRLSDALAPKTGGRDGGTYDKGDGTQRQ